MKLTKSLIKRLIQQQLRSQLGLQEQMSCPEGYTPVQLPDGNSECVPTEEEEPEFETYPQSRGGQTFPTTGTSTEDKPLPPAQKTTPARPEDLDPEGADVPRPKPRPEEDEDKPTPRPPEPGPKPDPKKRKKLTRRQRRRLKLRKKGLKILQDYGYKNYKDFYTQLEDAGLTSKLGRSGPDKTWGKKHQIALDDLQQAKRDKSFKTSEEKWAKGRAKKADDETIARMKKQDAENLYRAIKGGGTDEDAVDQALNSARDGYGLAKASDAFIRVLKDQNDTDDGGLVDWLKSDGLDVWADRVEQALKDRAMDKREKESAKGEYDDQDDSGELEENATYSSFPKQEKLFERWNRFLKRD